MNEERANSTRDDRRERFPEVDLRALAAALADGTRSVRYFLDTETGAIVRTLDEDQDAVTQALQDSLEYEERYEPVPALAATTLNGCRGEAHRLWLMAEALEWLGEVERARGLRFRAVGL